MNSKSISRRTFMTTTTGAMMLAALDGGKAIAQTQFKGRMGWETFRNSPQCGWFISAIAAMRANTNANDPHSMTYWTNVHVSSCKHGVPYFLSWHRGYLFYFERQLQEISGHPDLMLPYWDFYKNSTIPLEFTIPIASNPLYQPRINNNVSQALTLAPFSNGLTNFETGTVDAFEHTLESRPHDPVHDLIGNVMSTMNSPSDPIFWLHHSNIDRLWTAWVAAGNGRKMPLIGSPYWSMNFQFGPAFSMNNVYTTDPRILGYFYQDETLPQTIVAQAEPTSLTAFSISKHPRFRNLKVVDATPQTFATRLEALKEQIRTLPNRPAVKRFIESAHRRIDATRVALAGVRDVTLDHDSVSVKLRLTSEARKALQDVVARLSESPYGHSDTASAGTERFSDVQIVLDRISATDLGEGGGYFYKMFLNLDQNPDSSVPEQRHLIGTFGPFKIAAARNHARMKESTTDLNNIRIDFAATQLFANFSDAEWAEPVISFVRVSGEHTPVGTVIQIGEARIDLTSNGTG